MSVPLPEGVALRAMASSDVPRVRALHNNLLTVPYPIAFFIQLLLNPQRRCLVAVDGDIIIGFASAATSGTPTVDAMSRSDIPRLHVTLLTLGVLPAYRRKGIGRVLVCQIVQHLEGSRGNAIPRSLFSGHTRPGEVTVLVQVQVAPSNTAGKRFYAHLGMGLCSEIGSRTSVMAGMLSV